MSSFLLAISLTFFAISFMSLFILFSLSFESAFRSPFKSPNLLFSFSNSFFRFPNSFFILSISCPKSVFSLSFKPSSKPSFNLSKSSFNPSIAISFITLSMQSLEASRFLLRWSRSFESRAVVILHLSSSLSLSLSLSTFSSLSIAPPSVSST